NQTNHVALVRDERILDHTSVDSSPIEESTDQVVHVAVLLGRPNQPAAAQVSDKDANARVDMSPTIRGRAWTSAARPVARERRNGLLLDRLELNAFSLEPDNKVRDRVQMQSPYEPIVPGLGKVPLVLLQKSQ